MALRPATPTRRPADDWYIPGSTMAIGGGFEIDTFLSKGVSDVLTISWAGATGVKADIEFTVESVPSAVPLPASALLLLTALAGIAGLRRRNNRASWRQP